MKNYFCKWGLLHHKEVKTGEPTSNNGWIYLAYYKELGGEVNFHFLVQTLERCIYIDEDQEGFYLTRLPGKFEPPESRDEVIGKVCLVPSLAKDLIAVNYFYLGARGGKKFSIIEQLKTLWILRTKHRNYFWENELFEIYPLAFRLWHNDRYFLKKLTKRDEEINFFEFAFFYLNAVHTILFGKFYVKNILWLQLKKLNSKFLIRFIDHKKNFKKEFPADHPINNLSTS